VELCYRDRERRIDPWRLEFQRGRWYLTGLDHSHGEERNFRLDRIEGEVVLLDEDPFERPAAAQIPGVARGAWLLGGEEPVVARLRVDADHAPWAIQHVGPTAVAAEEADGSVVLELPVTNRDALRSFVLGFLHHAELLAPQELRDELVAWLGEVAAG
jgi:predicted DNA-binding transcriptional regulator YafY